ncbi:hypothetical protein [Natronomonas gomsonensis]|uniref:hypothetical protein n=1 Tax=Natronomonas gomsonensis TaxID=1046043 RepID=UPI0015BF19DA|nr:hypothetical protein [Natronomonas gomsonensis]
MNEAAVDQVWLHQLGRAEGIESLIDEELLADDENVEGVASRDRDATLRSEYVRCEWCGSEDTDCHGPEGEPLCQECYDDWNDALPELCSRCRHYEAVTEDGECERCRDEPPAEAFHP